MLHAAEVIDSIAKTGRKLAAEFAVLLTHDFELNNSQQHTPTK